MRIYVGRWDLLPAEWEGYNGLSEKSEEEIIAEVTRQFYSDEVYKMGDRHVGWFDPYEFEDTFNHDLTGSFNTNDYFIKFCEE